MKTMMMTTMTKMELKMLLSHGDTLVLRSSTPTRDVNHLRTCMYCTLPALG
jgi:hypothetical protein